MNLFLTTGEALVATRFSFDYGWYPDDDMLLETDLPYVSLWYTVGGEYGERDGESRDDRRRRARSLLIASEPLTVDISTWLEVPEYSMITAQRSPPTGSTSRRSTWMSDRPTWASTFLGTVPLLEGFPSAELAELARVMRRRTLRDGRGPVARGRSRPRHGC